MRVVGTLIVFALGAALGWIAITLAPEAAVGEPLEGESTQSITKLGFHEPRTALSGEVGEPQVLVTPDGTIHVMALGRAASAGADGRTSQAHLRSLAPGQETWADDSYVVAGYSVRDVHLAIDSVGKRFALNLLDNNGVLELGMMTWGSGSPGWNRSPEPADDNTHGSPDRPWISVAGDRLAAAWRVGPSGDELDNGLAVRTLLGNGSTATAQQVITRGVAWLGPIVQSGNGTCLYVPYTRDLEPAASPPDASRAEIVLARNLNAGGGAWELVPTNRSVSRTPGLQFSGTLMAPMLSVTDTGRLVLAWSEEAPAEARAAGIAATVRLTTSTDGGNSWAPTVNVSHGATAVLPAMVAGSGDRVAVAYYRAAEGTEGQPHQSMPTVWDVEAVILDASQPAEPLGRATVEEGVHRGGICTHGRMCPWSLLGGGTVDTVRQAAAIVLQENAYLLGVDSRQLLDYMGLDVNPAGELVAAYVNTVGDDTVVKVATQSGGPLVGPKASPPCVKPA